MRCLAMIALLLLAAATASADTQAAHSVQSSQSVQKTQATQKTQIFGLPPLPVALIAAGALLQKVHSPIKLNTKVVTDQPEQQAAPTDSNPAAGDSVYYGQAATGGDDTQQQYVSGNQPVSNQQQVAQPVSSGNSKVPPGVTSWIQNPDGSITPLKWEQPSGQATADQQTATDSQVTDMPQEGQVVSGTIVTGTTVPMQQTYTGGATSPQNVTYSTPDNTQIPDQDTSADGTMVNQDQQAPMVVAMPVTQPQPQQQQMWVPAAQGNQMMQGYYLPGQAKGSKVVQGYYGQGQAVYAVGTTVGGMPMAGGQGQRGWGVRKTQGQGWGSGGMRPAGMMMPAGGMGQMQQGPIGQGYMGQVQQGPIGQGYMGQVQQGPRGQGVGPMRGQGGMMTGGPRPMGPGSMGQGQMNGPAPGPGSTADDSSISGADDGSAQGQGPSGAGFGGNRGQQGRAVMEPTVVIIDQTQQSGNGEPQPSRVTVTPPQGQPGPRSSGPGTGPGPMQSGPNMGQVTGPARGPGGMARRPPAMVPVGGPQQGADGVMGGSIGGMDGDDNMNN